jgi:class 3 adenylate cyclase/pimeloyl-ACP methyl ester carboxylesterase
VIDLPDVEFTQASDGAYIAYQVVGEGSVDLAWQFDFFGNIDAQWESPSEAAWMTGLAAFSRLILHDRRATGLSSRDVPPPDLETRASDLLTVLDAVGSNWPVLSGLNESGALAALMASTMPERVRGLIWFEPRARPIWAPDYPWGWGPREVEMELAALDRWGTRAYATSWSEQAEEEFGVPVPESEVRFMAKASRQTCTPDVARELTRIWFETDVRALLPSVHVPTLLMVEDESPRRVDEALFVSSLIPDAELITISGPGWPSTVQMYEQHFDAVRRFVGVQSPPTAFDSILATIVFTDIVGSTERQASLGDRAWTELLRRHHALIRDALDRWQGKENDTAGDGFYATFDGPARAIRCALEIVARVRDMGIEVRAGVHTGECELVEGKCSGLSVSIGARVASHARASEVLVSQTVKDLVAGSGLRFEEEGEHELKGVPDRWRLYRVVG